MSAEAFKTPVDTQQITDVQVHDSENPNQGVHITVESEAPTSDISSNSGTGIENYELQFEEGVQGGEVSDSEQAGPTHSITIGNTSSHTNTTSVDTTSIKNDQANTEPAHTGNTLQTPEIPALHSIGAIDTKAAQRILASGRLSDIAQAVQGLHESLQVSVSQLTNSNDVGDKISDLITQINKLRFGKTTQNDVRSNAQQEYIHGIETQSTVKLVVLVALSFLLGSLSVYTARNILTSTSPLPELASSQVSIPKISQPQLQQSQLPQGNTITNTITYIFDIINRLPDEYQYIIPIMLIALGVIITQLHRLRNAGVVQPSDFNKISSKYNAMLHTYGDITKRVGTPEPISDSDIATVFVGANEERRVELIRNRTIKPRHFESIFFELMRSNTNEYLRDKKETSKQDIAHLVDTLKTYLSFYPQKVHRFYSRLLHQFLNISYYKLHPEQIKRDIHTRVLEAEEKYRTKRKETDIEFKLDECRIYLEAHCEIKYYFGLPVLVIDVVGGEFPLATLQSAKNGGGIADLRYSDGQIRNFIIAKKGNCSERILIHEYAHHIQDLIRNKISHRFPKWTKEINLRNELLSFNSEGGVGIRCDTEFYIQYYGVKKEQQKKNFKDCVMLLLVLQLYGVKPIVLNYYIWKYGTLLELRQALYKQLHKLRKGNVSLDPQAFYDVFKNSMKKDLSVLGERFHANSLAHELDLSKQDVYNAVQTYLREYASQTKVADAIHVVENIRNFFGRNAVFSDQNFFGLLASCNPTLDRDDFEEFYHLGKLHGFDSFTFLVNSINREEISKFVEQNKR